MNYPKKRKSISIEDRKKKSIALMGNTNGSYNKGKKHSLQTKLKIGASNKGEKNGRWKGGITNIYQGMRNLIEYKEWRMKVYKRDNFTCVWCGDKKGGNLEADHIKALSEYRNLAYVVSNGRTLCKKCHNKRTRRQLKALNLRLKNKIQFSVD